MEFSVFTQLTFILFIALLLSVVLRFLRQPLIIAYMLTGVVVGIFFKDFVGSETLLVFSQFGIAFLLFIVGLQLNPSILKDLGGQILKMGILQVIFTSIIGFGVMRILGYGILPSFYMAIALTFSSTVIISKLLSDRGDFTLLYGRLSVGLLLVQDILAILALIILSSVGKANAISWDIPFWFAVIRIIIICITLFIFMRFILPRFTGLMARNQDILFLFSIVWAIGLASLFKYLGFSMEAGALIAGVSLSSTQYHFEISSKIRPLRDFFIILFFVFLGLQLQPAYIKDVLTNSIFLTLFVLIANPLIMLVIAGWFGYKRRTSFGIGVTMAQVSEFSFILITMGYATGHLNERFITMITVVGILSIIGSVYLVKYQEFFINILDPFLKLFERKNIKEENKKEKSRDAEIILFGYNRIGFNVAEYCKKEKVKLFVVDHDPDVVVGLDEEGIDAWYGDASSNELIKDIDFNPAKIVISTIPDMSTNLLLLKTVKSKKKNIIFMAVAHQIGEAEELYANKADFVILPHFLGGAYLEDILKKHAFTKIEYSKLKEENIRLLKLRKKLGHEHPSIVNWFR